MYTIEDKNEKYIEMAEGENKMLVPSRAAIIVDDESTITTVKTIASRRTLASIDTSTPPPPHDYSQDYLTLVPISADTTFKFSGNTIDYSIDSGETWTSLPSNTATPSVGVGDKIMFKASGLTPTSNSGIGRFSATSEFDVEGNIMSLAYSDDFSGQTSLSGKSYAFLGLFSGSTVVSAENLSLPATTLAIGCYQSMFVGCSGLTTAPELPATTLADECYKSMFQGCTSLTTAPQLLATALTQYCYEYMFNGCTALTTAPSVLPATTLASGCYLHMFRNCTSLTVAPQLPATTLNINSYGSMFRDCKSLNSVTCLATDISAINCTGAWLAGVSSSGTFTKAASMESWTRGIAGIPNNWTVVDA